MTGRATCGRKSVRSIREGMNSNVSFSAIRFSFFMSLLVNLHGVRFQYVQNLMKNANALIVNLKPTKAMLLTIICTMLFMSKDIIHQKPSNRALSKGQII
jgi:hypothetical protein